MEEEAVSQSIRNWKLLSDLKESASSIRIQGEEASRDFSVFSKYNLYTKSQFLPAYDRLINRISFNKAIDTNKLRSQFSSVINFGHFRKSHQTLTPRHHANIFCFLAFASICVLIAILILFL